MKLPAGVVQLQTVEEVEAAWGDLFTLDPDAPEGEKQIRFDGDPRFAITVDAIYVKIRKPIMAGDQMELTDVLRLREPTVADLRLSDRFKGEIEKTICLIEAVGCIPKAEVNKLSAKDFALCGEAIAAFLSE